MYMKDINNHPLKDVSDHEKDGFIALNETIEALEDTELRLANAIIDVSAPSVHILIDGKATLIEPAYFDETINSFVQAALSERETSKIEKYLRGRYSKNGVPYSCLELETGLEAHRVKNWISEELNLNPRSPVFKELFVPFELVAQMIAIDIDSKDEV